MEEPGVGAAARGRQILGERVAASFAALREALEADVAPEAVRRARGVRRVVTTGLGSSAAHARFLAHQIESLADVPARFVSTTDFLLGRRRPAQDELLAVFSQGLSRNARYALCDPSGWGDCVVFTAAGDDASDDVRAWLDLLRDAGATIVRFPGENEYGTLLRVVGPVTAYASALRYAEAFAAERSLARGAPEPLDVDALCGRVESAGERLDAALASIDDRDPFDAPIVLLAAGSYAEIVDNLRFKWMEGLLRPVPPVWDLLHFAHGPFQQIHASEVTLIALTGNPSAAEQDLLDRIQRMLVPERHRLIQFPASLDPPLAIFEHEAFFNALVLRRLEVDGVNQVDWPGQDRDRPIYELGPELPSAANLSGSRESPRAQDLSSLTWPELEAALDAGVRTAVVPLGATEQHGPHLPFATDVWIADELGRRFCEAVPEAVRLPALAIGCSTEHMAFPGTLSLRPDTLRSVLDDLLASLRDHGFERAFVFTAHGGNVALLREAIPDLAATHAPLEVIAFTDHRALTNRLHVICKQYGVSPEAAGHHAGEIETSILSALRPQNVRRTQIGAGHLHGDAETQHLFYPSLRDNAPNGTVGDPRSASAQRASDYLDAWTDELVALYRRAGQLA